ncbi:MAG TPA: hypothetical protein VFN11_09370 [Ktedonobacterales bacterium]|nr:hypothetical protein [Ktedonobacterales bacterium]
MQQQQQRQSQQSPHLEGEDPAVPQRATYARHTQTQSTGGTAWIRRLLPIALILLLQAITALVVLQNTPHQAEALYLTAGRQLLLGRVTVDHYTTYFSGYPAFYPVIGGSLDLVGGLELARLFSMVCMLVVTGCVYFITARLTSRASASIAALLFALAGPTLYLSRLATYDALAFMFLALALALAVTIPILHAPTQWMVAVVIAPLLLAAIVAKYATLVFVPFVLLLLVLYILEHCSQHQALRMIALVTGTFVLLLGLVSLLAPRGVWHGLAFTTTARTAMFSETRLALLSTILPATSLMWVLGLVGLALIPAGTSRRLPLTLLAASVVAPAYHLYSGEAVSVYKHMDFAIFFVAPLAGYGLVKVGNRFVHNQAAHRTLVGVLTLLLLIVAILSAYGKYTSWPNMSQVAGVVGSQMHTTNTRCLCEDTEVLTYALTNSTQPQQFTGPYFFRYTTAKGTLLTGEAAYLAAIRAGYFDTIELSFTHWPLAGTLRYVLEHQRVYQLVAILPESNSSKYHFMVWAVTSGGGGGGTTP